MMESGSNKLIDLVFVGLVIFVLGVVYGAVSLHLVDPMLAIGGGLLVLVIIVAGYLYAIGYDFRKLLT